MAQAKALLQCARGEGVNLLKMVEPYHKDKCAKKGYEYRVFYGPYCPALSHFYEKFYHALGWMKDAPIGSFGCYADSDCIWTGEEELDGELGNSDLGMTTFWECGYNGGLILFRNTEPVQRMFQWILDNAVHEHKSPMWGKFEEYRINEYIARNLGSVKVRSLNSRWNFWRRANGIAISPIQIFAWHDMPDYEKARHMKRHLEHLKWQHQES